MVLALEPAGAYRSAMSESDRDSEHAPDPDGQRLFMEALGRLGPVLLGGLDGLEQDGAILVVKADLTGNPELAAQEGIVVA